MNLYFLDVHHPCNFICDKLVVGQNVSEKFPGSFRKQLDQLLYKRVRVLFTAGKLYFLFIKFHGVFNGIFRNGPLSEKISEICQNCQKYFPGDFSPEEISPGELSGIFRKQTLVYSRKIVFFGGGTSR